MIGARAALTLAYASGVLTYGVLAMATNIPMLFLSRAMPLFLAAMQGLYIVVRYICKLASSVLLLYYGFVNVNIYDRKILLVTWV